MNAFAHYEVIVHPEKNIVKKNTNFFEKGLTEKKDGFRMRGVKAKASLELTPRRVCLTF